MTPVTTKRPLTELTRQIEELEADARRLSAEQAAIAKQMTRARRRMNYLQLAKLFRRPQSSFEMWPTAAMLIGPAASGILLFVVVHLLSGAISLALLGALLGLAGGAAVCFSLLYRPPDSLFSADIADADSQLRLIDARLKEKLERVAESNARLKLLIDERRDQIASGKLQRAALLQRNWKSMPEAEWEDFVVEVLRTHGANVDRASRIRDEEPNLIADFGTQRVAMFTRSEEYPVQSRAIQRAIAAKDHHRCDRCAVIVNRRFTGAAQDYAQRNGCAAIGVSEFPDFVLGKIDL